MFYLMMYSTHFIYGYMLRTYGYNGKEPQRKLEWKPGAATS